MGETLLGHGGANRPEAGRLAGVRMFGGLGSMSSLSSWVGASWGRSQDGTPVSSQATWAAAVAQLRTPAGHSPASAGSFQNPVQWGVLDAMLNASTTTPTGGSLLSAVLSLQGAGIEPLLVEWLPCSVFAFTTLDPGSPTFWAEHWCNALPAAASVPRAAADAAALAFSLLFPRWPRLPHLFLCAAAVPRAVAPAGPETRTP